VRAFPIRGVVPVYRCAAGCDAVVASEGAICLGCAAEETCECETPKPVTIIDQTFGGLFEDTPETDAIYAYCDRCLLQIPQPPHARPGVR
jgi:hypothetical protein